MGGDRDRDMNRDMNMSMYMNKSNTNDSLPHSLQDSAKYWTPALVPVKRTSMGSGA